MGNRSRTETVVEIVLAFHAQGTWTQAALARHIGISSASLRGTLHEMTGSGLPLERQQDPPQVYWSVPRGWFPGGVVMRSEDADEMLRQLARGPRTKRRDQLMGRIVEAARGKGVVACHEAVVAPKATENEECFLPVVEDSASHRTTLAMRYFTASRGAVEQRHASVRLVMAGAPARFVATCHRDCRLKWFRVENVMAARLDATEPFLDVRDEEVAAFQRESLDGFHQGLPAQALVFTVRDPESRWVGRNLLEGMVSEPLGLGIRVTAKTAAPLRVARFVVGLGGAACAETRALAVLVRELATGALQGGTCAQ